MGLERPYGGTGWRRDMAITARILTARRSYELHPDDISLTLLSGRAVTERIREHFGFQFVEVNTPPETFGPVPPTYPPGLVCGLGTTTSPEAGLTAIRSLFVEPRRVVIEVAGASRALDPIFDEFRKLLQGIQGSDGPQVIGEPTRKLDYSEFSVQLRFPPRAILPPDLQGIVEAALGDAAGDSGRANQRVIVPLVQVRLEPPEQEYLGTRGSGNEFFHLDLRANTSPDDRVYYSAASLDTDAHLALLERIDDLNLP